MTPRDLAVAVQLLTLRRTAQIFGLGLLLGAVAGAAGWARLTRPDPGLVAAADTLTQRFAARDSVRAATPDVRPTVRRLQQTAQAHAAAAAAEEHRFDSLAAAVQTSAQARDGGFADSVAQLIASAKAIARRRQAEAAAERSAALLLVGGYAYWRDTAAVELRGEREDAMALTRRAIAQSRRRSFLERAVTATACAVAGVGVAKQNATVGVAGGVLCLAGSAF